MQIKTEININLQKRLKKRGYLFVTTAAILLFIGANVLTIKALEKVGLWIFLTAIVFIHLGLKPYKEAKKRIFAPDLIHIENAKLTHLNNDEKITLAIAIQDIKKISHRNQKYPYGILITTNKENRTYFLPYFTKSAYEKLISHAALQNIMHFNQSN